jgi:AcrR family transcriptional regulator
MGRRGVMKITTRDVAEAVGVDYRTVLRHEKEGRWTYGDLDSIISYIIETTERRRR